MDTRKAVKPASIHGLETVHCPNKSEQGETGPCAKTPKQLPNQKCGGIGKNSANYWQGRIYKPKNDRGQSSPHYAMQLQFQGHRLAFSLRTGNQAAAARIAAGIYSDLLTLGTEGTLAKHRSGGTDEETATVGEWIAAAEKVFDGKPGSFAGYARSLRLIAAEILSVKKTSKRYSRKGGEYRKAADAVSLATLTPEAIQGWRIAYVKSRGRENPSEQRAARITCNSIVRMARSLFSPKVRGFIPLLLLPDPIPFAGVKFYPRESMKYQSKIDPGILLRTAEEQLARAEDGATHEQARIARMKREAFKILMLAIGAGLRRGEIDRLLWRQVDFRNGVIRIEITEVGALKTEDSAGEVAIDPVLCEILQGFKARASGQFVIEGLEDDGIGSRSWGHAYRCNPVFEFLTHWLRKNGVDAVKPLHTLRKEAGAMIATRQGIYAASKFLRHADIQVTAMHYADHKERITIGIGELFTPSGKVVQMPGATSAPAPAPTPTRTTARRKSA